MAPGESVCACMIVCETLPVFVIFYGSCLYTRWEFTGLVYLACFKDPPSDWNLGNLVAELTPWILNLSKTIPKSYLFCYYVYIGGLVKLAPTWMPGPKCPNKWSHDPWCLFVFSWTTSGGTACPELLLLLPFWFMLWSSYLAALCSLSKIRSLLKTINLPIFPASLPLTYMCMCVTGPM